MNHHFADRTPPSSGSPSETRPAPLDGFSVTSLLTSLTFSLAPLGLIVGVVGMTRTEHGVRRGRGLAITGLTISGAFTALATAAFSVGVFFIEFSEKDNLDLDHARTGQ